MIVDKIYHTEVYNRQNLYFREIRIIGCNFEEL